MKYSSPGPVFFRQKRYGLVERGSDSLAMRWACLRRVVHGDEFEGLLLGYALPQQPVNCAGR